MFDRKRSRNSDFTREGARRAYIEEQRRRERLHRRFLEDEIAYGIRRRKPEEWIDERRRELAHYALMHRGDPAWKLNRPHIPLVEAFVRPESDTSGTSSEEESGTSDDSGSSSSNETLALLELGDRRCPPPLVRFAVPREKKEEAPNLHFGGFPNEKENKKGRRKARRKEKRESDSDSLEELLEGID